MRRMMQRFVLALVVAGVGFTVVNPAWATSLGCDVWNISTLNEQLAESERQGHYLDELMDSTARQMQINESIVDDLAHARRSLKDAATLMVAMNQSRSDYMGGVESISRGTTVEAKMADNLIRLVVMTLESDRHPVVTTLREQYRHAYESSPSPTQAVRS
jgi:urease gamma subunit